MYRAVLPADHAGMQRVFPADRPFVERLDDDVCVVSDGQRVWVVTMAARDLLLCLGRLGRLIGAERVVG
jgi:hypothetical protein